MNERREGAGAPFLLSDEQELQLIDFIDEENGPLKNGVRVKHVLEKAREISGRKDNPSLYWFHDLCERRHLDILEPNEHQKKTTRSTTELCVSTQAVINAEQQMRQKTELKELFNLDEMSFVYEPRRGKYVVLSGHKPAPRAHGHTRSRCTVFLLIGKSGTKYGLGILFRGLCDFFSLELIRHLIRSLSFSH